MDAYQQTLEILQYVVYSIPFIILLIGVVKYKFG